MKLVGLYYGKKKIYHIYLGKNYTPIYDFVRIAANSQLPIISVVESLAAPTHPTASYSNPLTFTSQAISAYSHVNSINDTFGKDSFLPVHYLSRQFVYSDNLGETSFQGIKVKAQNNELYSGNFVGSHIFSIQVFAFNSEIYGIIGNSVSSPSLSLTEPNIISTYGSILTEQTFAKNLKSKDAINKSVILFSTVFSENLPIKQSSVHANIAYDQVKGCSVSIKNSSSISKLTESFLSANSLFTISEIFDGNNRIHSGFYGNRVKIQQSILSSKIAQDLFTSASSKITSTSTSNNALNYFSSSCSLQSLDTQAIAKVIVSSVQASNLRIASSRILSNVCDDRTFARSLSSVSENINAKLVRDNAKTVNLGITSSYSLSSFTNESIFSTSLLAVSDDIQTTFQRDCLHASISSIIYSKALSQISNDNLLSDSLPSILNQTSAILGNDTINSSNLTIRSGDNNSYFGSSRTLSNKVISLFSRSQSGLNLSVFDVDLATVRDDNSSTACISDFAKSSVNSIQDSISNVNICHSILKGINLHMISNDMDRNLFSDSCVKSDALFAKFLSSYNSLSDNSSFSGYTQKFQSSNLLLQFSCSEVEPFQSKSVKGIFLGRSAANSTIKSTSLLQKDQDLSHTNLLYDNVKASVSMLTRNTFSSDIIRDTVISKKVSVIPKDISQKTIDFAFSSKILYPVISSTIAYESNMNSILIPHQILGTINQINNSFLDSYCKDIIIKQINHANSCSKELQLSTVNPLVIQPIFSQISSSELQYAATSVQHVQSVNGFITETNLSGTMSIEKQPVWTVVDDNLDYQDINSMYFGWVIIRGSSHVIIDNQNWLIIS